MIVGISGLFTASVQSDDLESVKKVKWTYEACMKGNIPLIGAQHVEIDVTWSGRYFREEVIPWFFSVCASISRTGVQLHEIDIWLDPRSLNEFYGALMFTKVNIIVT